jgi:hypothetical protein
MTPKQAALLMLCASCIAAQSPKQFAAVIHKMISDIGDEMEASGQPVPQGWMEAMVDVLKEVGG